MAGEEPAAGDEFAAEEEDFGAEEELDGDLEVQGDLAAQDENEIADAQAEIEAMKARLAEMEEEATKLRDTQTKGGAEAAAGTSAVTDAAREEADNRSVYVGQVDYACTPEELQMHFQGCGTVNRVTILSDKFGNPKGFAYIEFLEPDAVQAALLLDNSELRGRAIKVLPKRTNVPGLKPGRGRGRGGGFYGGRGGGRYGGYGGRGSYGYVPRGRGRGRGRFYSPY